MDTGNTNKQTKSQTQPSRKKEKKRKGTRAENTLQIAKSFLLNFKAVHHGFGPSDS